MPEKLMRTNHLHSAYLTKTPAYHFFTRLWHDSGHHSRRQRMTEGAR